MKNKLKELFRYCFSTSQLSWQDTTAALSIAGLLIPEAVAYASIANMPAQAGLIALFAGLICYGILGSSKLAIVSATSSSAAVLAGSLLSFVTVDKTHYLPLAFGLVVLTGMVFLIAALAKMGKVTDYISRPVLRGFTFGIAMVIVLKQFASMAGLHLTHHDFFNAGYEILSQVAAWNWVSISIGGLALGLLFLFARFKQLPSGLLVIVLGIGMNHALNLAQYHVHMVGDIAMTILAPSIPVLSHNEWLRLGEIAIALAMILYSESYGSIRVSALKHSEKMAPNRDLLALGVANIVSGLFHGMPVGAGYSATTANDAAGATSRFAGLLAALIALVIIAIFLPAIAYTPEPVLAAIVIYVVSHTLNLSIFKTYFAWRRDRLVAIFAVLAVLSLGLMDGLLVAIGLSIMMALKRFSESSVSILGKLGQGHDFVDLDSHTDAHAIDGLMILRPDEPLFFANVEHMFSLIRHALQQANRPIHCVILSLEESPDLDSSSIESCLSFFERMAMQNKKLILARVKPSAHEVLLRALKNQSWPVTVTELSVDDAVAIFMQPSK